MKVSDVHLTFLSVNLTASLKGSSATEFSNLDIKVEIALVAAIDMAMRYEMSGCQREMRREMGGVPGPEREVRRARLTRIVCIATLPQNNGCCVGLVDSLKHHSPGRLLRNERIILSFSLDCEEISASQTSPLLC